MSDLKRVQSGQKLAIPAQTWNTVLDATEDYLRRRGDVGSSSSAERHNSTVVLVRNDSGSDVDRMNVLGIDAPLIPPDANMDSFVHMPALIGVLPIKPYYLGKIAVAMEPIASGKIGLACVGGICAAKVSMTDLMDQYADVSGVTTHLVSGQSGARILWCDDATPANAIILLPPGGGGIALPAGNADWDLLRWDSATSTWVILPKGANYLPLQATPDGLEYTYVRFV